MRLGRPENVWVWGTALLMVSGCASHEIKVACDGKLQRINPPSVTASRPQEGSKPVSVARTAGDKTP